jgi:hypothetical protein
MQITLNKANKLFAKFKQTRKDLRAVFERSRFYHEDEKVEAITTIEVSLANLTPRIVEEIQNMVDIYHRQYSDFVNIMEDFFNLKEAVFSANQRTGISQRLSRIEFLTEKLKLIDDLINESKRNKRLTLRAEEIDYQLLVQNLTHQEGKGELHISVFELSRLQQERQEVVNQMSQLEDEVAVLNNQTIIEVIFSEASRQLAGLE